MKTPEDERYVVIKAYKCTVSEIWRDSFVLPYIACTSYPYIQSRYEVPCQHFILVLEIYFCPVQHGIDG